MKDEKYSIGRVYIDEDGNLPVMLSFPGHVPGVPDGYYHLGDVESDEEMLLGEFVEWLADECPDSDFPDCLTAEDIEEIREDTRNGPYYQE